MEEQNLKQVQETKVCKHCQSEIPKKAKVCPNCRKKQGGKLKFVIIALVAIVIIASIMNGGGNDSPSDSNPKKVNQSDSSDNEKNNEKEEEEKEDEKDEKKVFVVGDIVETSDLKITFVSGKKYKSKNEYTKPKKGNDFYKMEFEFENKSDSDKTLSTVMDWTCYADSYKVDQAYTGDDSNGLDATLSSGKKAKGSIYFEVPKDAKEITLEYSPSFWSNDKVVFKIK